MRQVICAEIVVFNDDKDLFCRQLVYFITPERRFYYRLCIARSFRRWRHNIMICDKVAVIPEVEERDPAKLLWPELGGKLQIKSLSVCNILALHQRKLPRSVPLFMLTYTNRSLNWISPNPPTDNVTGLPATLAESIPNYLRAASAVILVDIGIWKNSFI